MREYQYIYKAHEYTIETIEKNEIVDINHRTEEDEIVRVLQNDGYTKVILGDGTKGVAKCNPEDEFDARKGLNIAYNRARIKQREKELKNLLFS